LPVAAYFKSDANELGYILGAGLGGFDDEDKYDAIGDSVKSRNMISAYGSGYTKIPIPYGAGFFITLVEFLQQRNVQVRLVNFHIN